MNMLMIGAGVLLLCQLVSMIMVLRASSERPDLVGLGRIMPVVISLIPVFGPFLAGRATGAGIRPVFPSLIGTVVLVGTLLVGPKGGPPKPQTQASAAGQAAEGQAAEGAAEGQPAEGATDGQPAEGGAEAQPAADAAATQPTEDAASPEAVPTPAPTAEQPPVEQPEAAPAETTPPADTLTAEAPPDELLVSVAPTDEATLAAEAAALASYQPVRPLIGGRQVLAEAQLRLPGQHGLQSEYEYVFDGPTAKGLRFARLQIGVSVTRPPHSAGPRQLYLGGRLLSYDHRVIDRFYPVGVNGSSLEVGRRFYLRTLRGYYEAEFRVAELKLTDDGQVEAAAFDVRIR